MQHLDLVITSDTAIAHLAGALGVRVLAGPGESCGLAMVVGSGRESVVSDDAVVERLEGDFSAAQHGNHRSAHLRSQRQNYP